jgi:predicted MFS family arabinose efflux permease
MKKWSETALLWGFLLVLIISYALFAKGKGFLLVPLVLINLGVQGIYSPFTKTLLNRSISYSPMRATLLSLESSVKRFSVALLMPILGLFIDKFGIKYGLFFSAGIGTLSLLILLWTFTDKLKKSLHIEEKNTESQIISSENLKAPVD